MKKSILIFLCFFSLSNYSNAQQPWAQPGATWWYSYNTMTFIGNLKCEKVGDTLVNNIHCDMIRSKHFGYEYLNSSWQTFVDTHYTYISNDTVYHFVNNQFHPLYYYSSQVNDVIPAQGVGCSDPVYRVDSIGALIVNADTLKQFYITAFDSVFQYAYQIQVLEKLGSNFGLFPEFVCYMDGANTILLCYYDDSGFSYNSNISANCDSTVGIATVDLLNSTISSFPNPCTEQIYIDTEIFAGNEQNAIVNVIDFTGRSVLNRKGIDNEGIPVTSFSDGVYYLIVWLDNRKYSSTFIKRSN